jgi:5-methylthioadenosine/S-adenosylhomocysteine deaminase
VLLLADLVIPVSAPPLADAGVRVAEGRIAEVGPAAELRARYAGDETRVFEGCALLPGFVNSHTHLELSAFRGFTRASSFGPWMLRLLLARRKLTPGDYEASALWGAYECARCGVTSIADTAYDGVVVARAAGRAGLRARVYQEVFGLDDDALPSTMDHLRDAIGRLERESTSLVEAGVSPHAPYTVSARLYREVACFARRAGLRMATHVAESRAEIDVLDRGAGAIAGAYRRAHMWEPDTWKVPHARPLGHVASTGALTPEMLVIHAVQIDDQEVALLGASGVGVAHCPRSNARLHCGVAPVADMLAAGTTVGLGTDSLASNDSLDMFAEMRAALLASEQRERAGSGLTSALTPQQVLRMATWDGARALGWADLTGSLDPGKSADITAVRLPGAHGEPSPDRVAANEASSPARALDSLLAVATAADVRLTMVAGRVVFSGGTPPGQVASGYRAARHGLGLG